MEISFVGWVLGVLSDVVNCFVWIYIGFINREEILYLGLHVVLFSGLMHTWMTGWKDWWTH